jgi:hypothetical protein
MKIKKPFNGLTSGEHQRLTEIRMLAQVDFVTAKRAAADWVLSNNGGAYCAKPRAAQSSLSRLDRDRPFPQADRRAFDVRSVCGASRC